MMKKAPSQNARTRLRLRSVLIVVLFRSSYKLDFNMLPLVLIIAGIKKLLTRNDQDDHSPLSLMIELKMLICAIII